MVHDSNALIGFLVASVIFFITIILVAKYRIGFFRSLLFLLFSLLAGLTIANQDLIRAYLKGERSEEESIHHFKEQLLKGFDDLKQEWEKEKQKWQEPATPKS